MERFSSKYGISTLVNGWGERQDPLDAHVAPIYQTSVFKFPDFTSADSILSGEGDGDAAVFVLGLFTGAAFAHNFALAAAPDKMVEGVLVTGGPGTNGQIAVGVGLLFCLVLGFAMRERFD